MRNTKTQKQTYVEKMSQAEIDLENAAGEALCNIGSAVMKGRNHEEQIALAEKLTALVEGINSGRIKIEISKKSVEKEQATATSEDSLGEKSAELMDVLSNAIARERTIEEQIGLIEQLTSQVEANNATGVANKGGATELAEDADIFIEHARHFYKNLRRKVYQSLCFLCSIEEIGQDIFFEDFKNQLFDMKKSWAENFKQELADSVPDTIKLKKAS